MISLFSDNSTDSKEAKRLLKDYGITFEEVSSIDDGEFPHLLDSESAVPFFGLSGVKQYIDLFGQKSINKA